MKTILLMQCGRTIPKELGSHCRKMGFELKQLDSATDAWKELLPTAYAIMLLLPAWSGKTFLAPESLWYQFLLNNYSHLRLFFVSFQANEHDNHFDLLNLNSFTKDHWVQVPNVMEMKPPPNFEGLDLNDKLRRFFAGHGQDSVVAVLTRIRLVVQMASREVLRMDTPYEEIFKELVQPAQIHIKWTEWRNRWIHYYPLFQFTPFADKMQKVATASATLEEWMSSGGQDEDPLKSGRVLSVLNEVRTELKAIEEQYVVQKLSHTYR